MSKAYIEISRCSTYPFYRTDRQIRPVLNHRELKDVHYCLDTEMGETDREAHTTQFDTGIHKDCFIIKEEGRTLKI